MKNRQDSVEHVEKLLSYMPVEMLAKRDDLIAGSYQMPGIVGVIVGVDAQENFQYGCAHFTKGHDKIQKIKVAQTQGGNDVVAVYKVIKGNGTLYLNDENLSVDAGQVLPVKQGTVFKVKNGQSYCLAGDLVVAEVFDPAFSPETHFSTEEDNPMLSNAFGG